MLPQINGKDLLLCNEEDLSILLDNSDYRENDYLDYKQSFPFLKMDKGKEKDTKKTEFKNDICSFANAEGGYMVFGISDKNGCANTIDGIDIINNDTDHFEIERRNDLSGIQPRIPSIKFAFIKLSTGRYVVVIYIRHDEFAPYVYLEDEKNYKIYRRYGNGKKVIGYNELKQMFIRSISLEQSIKEYRKERILYYNQLGESFGNRLAHFCIIPETFKDLNYRKNMFALARTKKINFYPVFSDLGIDSSMIPCVDGVRFVPYSADRLNTECYVKNNGIVEVCISLDGHLNHDLEKYPNGFLPWEWLWKLINSVIYNYGQAFKSINIGERVYLCMSLIGCRNVQTEEQRYSFDNTGHIDRNEVICDPVEIINLNDDTEYENVIKKLYISYLLAIGVKNNQKLNKLIDEVYGT